MIYIYIYPLKLQKYIRKIYSIMNTVFFKTILSYENFVESQPENEGYATLKSMILVTQVEFRDTLSM